jgi:hypothetical protein
MFTNSKSANLAKERCKDCGRMKIHESASKDINVSNRPSQSIGALYPLLNGLPDYSPSRIPIQNALVWRFIPQTGLIPGNLRDVFA